MNAFAMTSSIACPTVASVRSVRRSSRVATRCIGEDAPTGPVKTRSPESAEPIAVAAPAQASGLAAIMTESQELINGRAAMVGVLAAIAGEVATGKDAWEQVFPAQLMAGEPSTGINSLDLTLFGFVVVASTLGTVMPGFISDKFNKDQSVGPFSNDAEILNARAAMIGFWGILVVEHFKGSAIF